MVVFSRRRRSGTVEYYQLRATNTNRTRGHTTYTNQPPTPSNNRSHGIVVSLHVCDARGKNIRAAYYHFEPFVDYQSRFSQCLGTTYIRAQLFHSTQFYSAVEQRRTVLSSGKSQPINLGGRLTQCVCVSICCINKPIPSDI